MEMGRENLQGLARALEAVGHDAAHQNDAVGQAAQGDGCVHIGQRGRQGNDVPVGGNGLEAEQLEQRADKDIHACAEDVGTQELVAVGAVVLGHTVEHPHHGLHGQLQLPRDHLEAGDRKQPQQQRRQQDHAHHYQRGYVRGVHVFQPKQTDAVGPVEHRVTHGLLHRLRLPVPWHQERTGQQSRRDQQPPHDEPCFLLFFHSLITFTYGPDFAPLRRFSRHERHGGALLHTSP